MALSGCLVIVRLIYKRIQQPNSLGADDWIILGTAIVTIPSAIINVKVLAGNGLGKDIWTLTPQNITNFGKGFYCVAMLDFIEVSLLKMSILFFYRRKYPGKQVHRVVMVIGVCNAVFGLSFVLLAAFQCHPISYNWTRWRGEDDGQCLDVDHIAWANAIISILLDLLMLAIPFLQVKDLNLHWTKKITVGCMFILATL